LALNLGAGLDPIKVEPVCRRWTPSKLAGSALKRREAHERVLWQKLKKTGEPTADCDWHEPGMQPAIRRLNPDRRFYPAGRGDQGIPDRPATQQVLRVGANWVALVAARHG
jgi:hypothetical protein